MLKAILFDLDGTLVDTEPLHYQTWLEVLREYEMEIDHEFFKARISGRLNPLILQDILPELSFEAGKQLTDYKEAKFREIGLSLTPLAGLLDLLTWIDNHNLKKALVTNAPRDNVNFFLKVLKLSNYFDEVILAEETPAGKPDPIPYKIALNQLDISANEAIAFEDSVSGIKSAVGAGIYTIGIASSHEPELLFQTGAAMVIPDFTEKLIWQLLDLLV
jgi:HAD superfamily hydrolase (TIGR01509 family)